MLPTYKSSFITVILKAAIFVGLAVTALQSNNIYAGTFSVNPVRVYLDANQSSTSLEITNLEKHPVTIQAQTFDWTQVPGQPDLTATSNLVVSPPILKLEPGASHTIRLALIGARTLSAERAFRLILQEVPIVNTLEGSGVRFTLRISLPVFVAPKEAKPALDWAIINDCTAKPVLQATNSGGRHSQIVKLSLRHPDTDIELQSVRPSKYVLAGESTQWELPNIQASWPDLLKLEIQSIVDSSALDVAVAGRCQQTALSKS